MHKRHNFTQKTIDTLRSRVGNRCSNPKCRVPTTGPAKDANKVNSIGIAAHIYAASPGGPRYNSIMTKEQRCSIENGIFLCSNCSIKIDKDPDSYPVDDLIKWKQTSETKSLLELGNQLPDQDTTIQCITSAISGFASNFLSDSIRNVCKASAQALEQVDPRFKVDASYNNGITSFDIKAKEPVAAKLNINSQYVNEFRAKYANFINYGEILDIDSNAISISGSDIFEKFKLGGSGRFTIQPKTYTAILKVILVDLKSGVITSFDDVIGEISIGKKSFNFTGYIYDGLLKISISKSISVLKEEFQFKTYFDFSVWNSQPVHKLKYFTKIYDTLFAMKNGCSMNVKLEIDGEKLLSGNSIIPKEDQLIQNLYIICHYLKSVRGLIEDNIYNITYDNNFKYDSEEHDILYHFSELKKSKKISNASEFVTNAKSTITTNKRMVELLKSDKSIKDFALIQRIANNITIFGKEFELPREKHTLTNVIAKASKDVNNIKVGDEIEIEWLPVDDCQYIVEIVAD